MTHQQTAVQMMAQDLRNAGYKVAQWGTGLVISLHRTISKMEVWTALDQAGYEESQFNMRHLSRGRIAVEAQTA